MPPDPRAQRAAVAIGRDLGAAARRAAFAGCGLLVALAFGLAACQPGRPDIAPPEIRYGEDVCADCNMIISDPRFASAYVHEVSPGRYESLAFDDLGDMLLHAAAHPEQVVAAWYVHDHATEDWLDAARAHFVHGEGVQSPMAFGYAAFGDEVAAREFAGEVAGEVVTWETVRSRVVSSQAR